MTPARPLLPALLAALVLAGPAAARPFEKPAKQPAAAARQAPVQEVQTSTGQTPGPPASPSPAPPVEGAATALPQAPSPAAAAAPPSPPVTAPGPPVEAAAPAALPPQPPSPATAPAPPGPPAATPAEHAAPPALPTLLPAPPGPAAAAAPRPPFPVQPAVEPEPGLLAGLAAWAGCAPHCPAAAGRAGMRLRSNFVLAFPPLRATLEQMLGRRPLAELLRLAEAGPPVEQRDDWLRIALCRHDACATAFMVLFVRPVAGEILLCWHEERWEPQRLRWSENRGGVWRTGQPGPKPLPPEGCNNRGPLEGHDWDLLRRLADQ